MEEKKRVGIWVRVSTEYQVKDESPEHHEKRARLYAEAKAWEVVEVYRLEAVSGKTVMELVETKKMLRDIQSGRITALVFSKLARLARNTKELLEFSELFRQANADMISLAENIDTSSPSGRLFFTIIAAMAEWERAEIAERVAASVPIRAKMGKPLGGAAPFGFQWVDKQLVIDKHEAPVRKLMYELFTEHRKKGVVARKLNEMGYRTRNGSKFSDTTIGRLLHDSTAKGVRVANYTKSLGEGKNWVIKPESDWIYITCPAIVSDELWDECSKILEQQEEKNKRATKPAVHLFSGILFCGCGGKMYVYSDGIKYKCSKCRKTKIETGDIEEIYYENLKSFLLTDEDIEKFLSKADEVIAQKALQLQMLNQDKKRIVVDMDKTMQLYMSGQIPKDGFAKYYNPLDTQLKQIENTIPEIEAEIDFLRIEYLNGDTIINEAKNLYDRWGSLQLDAKRQIVEQITERITIAGDEIKFKFSYNPAYFQNAENGQRNLTVALGFWKSNFAFKNPLFFSTSDKIGDQIRGRRMKLGLLQKDVAALVGVCEDTVRFWESGLTKPAISQMPAVLQFLGQAPQPIQFETFGEEIKWHRTIRGLSQKKMACLLDVNEKTIYDWENNKHMPFSTTIEKVKKLVQL